MALQEDGRYPLLLGHLADGGVALLLPDGDAQHDPEAPDNKGLEAANVRPEENSALQAIQQRWQDNTVEDADLGDGLDLPLMPQDPGQRLEGR